MSSPKLSPPPEPRSPWQRFYAGVHGLRAHYYRSRALRLPRPVISVGNLHWGGSGKTPMTAAIATHLRQRGWSPTILSRGYGSKGKGVRIVSRGQGPLLGPRLAGDEPVLLAGMLDGVAVVVCPDRHHAGQHALERLDPAPDIFLLDDGFSHLRLHRDLDILVFPASDPFAGGRLLPSGRLREPLVSSRRAHAAVLSGAGGESGLGHDLAMALRPPGFAGPGFISRTVSEPARPFGPGQIKPGSAVLAVSAIARPERFLDTVQQQRFRIVDHLSFPDHHRYSDAALEQIGRVFEQSGAQWVVTTGKDRVKLQGRLKLPAAEIPVHAQPEPELFRWLDLRLDEIRKRPS